MLFNSWQFGLFVAVVFSIHFLTPGRWRWLVLLVGSYFFYACWRWEYVFLILGVSAVTWYCALQIGQGRDKLKRHFYLGSALMVSLGALFFFKYYNFAQASVSTFVRALGGAASFDLLQIALPVGLSFYTLQAMSYVLDVYFGKVPADKHFGRVALFISFFPKLISGPIDRAGNLLAQINGKALSRTSEKRILDAGFRRHDDKEVIPDLIGNSEKRDGSPTGPFGDDKGGGPFGDNRRGGVHPPSVPPVKGGKNAEDMRMDPRQAHSGMTKGVAHSGMTEGVDPARLVSGLQLVLWGLFKKLVIADRLAIYVNAIFSDPGAYSGPSLLLGAYFFTFQIYCDFSGYTDIAIGTARLLGYDLVPNFRLPYFATSIVDFWRRWHMSLSTWFRDYLYIPLGGNRLESSLRWMMVIMVVFVVSGLWHGAAWTFIIWGGLHGVYYLMAKWMQKPAQRVSALLGLPGFVGKGLRMLVTFHAVALAWIFFRARSVEEAWLVIKGIFTSMGGPFYVGSSQLTTVISVGAIFFLIVVQMMQAKGWIPLYRYQEGHEWPLPLRWAACAALVFGISILGVSSNQFIYFQF